MTTLTVRKITRTVIKNQAKNQSVTKIKFGDHPFYFKYKKNRSKGSFFYVHYKNKEAKWEKIGNYPDTSPETAALRINSVSINNGLGVSDFGTVEEVLIWYRDRTITDVNKRKTHRSTIQSIINIHLIPKVGRFALDSLRGIDIDTHLYREMRDNYKLSYVAQTFKILRAAFNQAISLQLLATNPVADFTFIRFAKKNKIKPKPAAIYFERASFVKKIIDEQIDENYKRTVFTLFMIFHGTRIGETRLLKWEYFNFQLKELRIPAEITKTQKVHYLPLTNAVIDMLRQFRIISPRSNTYLFGRPNHPICHKTGYNWVLSVSGGQWCAHDLRKFFSDCLYRLKVQDIVRSALINHVKGKLDSTYTHSEGIDLKRDALDTYNAFLIRQHGFTLKTKTIPERENNTHVLRLHSKWM